MTDTPLMELRNVSKSFAGIQALGDVSISVRAGSVLCLLGDNGAGKSTLIKILSGFHAPTSGAILVDGVETGFESPREARNRGVATVHQEGRHDSADERSAEFLPGRRTDHRLGPIQRFQHRLCRENCIGANPRLRSDACHPLAIRWSAPCQAAKRQVVAIARAMYFGARVLILDEPTSALGVKEAAKVLTLMRAAAKRGIGVVFITHNARHAMLVGDHFVVLNHGMVSAAFTRGEKNRDEVLNLMAGGKQTEEIEADLALFEEDGSGIL